MIYNYEIKNIKDLKVEDNVLTIIFDRTNNYDGALSMSIDIKTISQLGIKFKEPLNDEKEI